MRLIIVTRGGVVESVHASQPDVEVEIVDWDGVDDDQEYLDRLCHAGRLEMSQDDEPVLNTEDALHKVY